MSKTVVLTGYAGFIGSQILRDLIRLGYNVIGLDYFGQGSSESNFSEVKDKFTGYNVDIADTSKLLEILIPYQNNIDYIVNCGAESHVDRCYSEVDLFVTSNILGPINLAKFAVTLPNLVKFVQVSTDEVYGESPQPYTEYTEIKTGNAYASSKASAELFLHNYYKAFKLPLVITNGANTYGPRQAPEKIIPKTIQKLLNDEKIPLYKTPAQRMWLHVEDHSSGIIAAMEEGIPGERYCLAPELNNELYTEDLVKKICNLLNKDSSSFITKVDDRPNYDLRYLMLNTKAKTQLKWYPTKNIEEELPKVIESYIKQ